MKMNMLDLPTEILVGLCYYLEPNETISLSLVNNSTYLLIHNNPIIWRFYCHKYGFVQFKSDGMWCHNEFKLCKTENKTNNRINNYAEKNQLRIKRSFTPKEEVEAYRIEFGNDDTYLRILEYDWWKKDDHNNDKNGGIKLDFVQNIVKGKKLVYEWSKNELIDTNIDISFATELVNWRLVFYMNILNEDSNNTFWLRVGNSIDIMTPITTVKIDPKIYKDMDESISEKVCELARKIKYLSTLHTCRHFIRLPCPMRIREIIVGGRIGNIITSEPNSQGRYLLELPIELVHCIDEYDDLLIHNYNFMNKETNSNEEVILSKNKLQLPANIFNNKRSMDDGHLNNLIYSKKRENVIDNLNSMNILKSGSECREKERKINLKLNYNLYKKISLTNAFISFASSANWKTSLTPRSVSVFKQITTVNSDRKNGKDKDLFIELLMSEQKKRDNSKKNDIDSYITNIYSNNYRTHSPINCTTPCSVINRTCNIEFHNIKEYFDMLSSNSIIFNMFATSINLQYSCSESGQNVYCWCEYPKSLVGCTWKYNPVKSDINEIKSMMLNLRKKNENSQKNNEIINEINKFSNKNHLNAESKESLEIMIKVNDISGNEIWRKYLNTSKSTNQKSFIALKRDGSCLVDLISSVMNHISDCYMDDSFYPIFILRGFGWIPQNDRDQNNSKVEEAIKKIFITMKNLKGNNLIKLIKNNIQELMSNLSENYSFVNGELIHVMVKDYSVDIISSELKDQIKNIGDIVIPVCWTLDGKNVNKIGILPYDEKMTFNQEDEADIQKLSSFSTLSTLASFDDINFISKQKFSRCKVIIIKREVNRFDNSIEEQIIDEMKEFNIKNLLNLINELFNCCSLNIKQSYQNNNKFFNFNNCQVSHLNTLVVNGSSELHKTFYKDNNKLCELNAEENEIINDKQSCDNSNSFDNCVKISILNSSEDTRQFEFNSKRSDLILVGTSFGKVRLIDRYRDIVVGEEGTSISPIIGLSWLNNHPELFIAGSCLLGSISILSMKENPFYMDELAVGNSNNEIKDNIVGSIYYDSHNYHYCNKSNNTNDITNGINRQYPYIIKIEKQTKAFPQLSSISVNATDDYFLTSGFGKAVALYNVYSGSFIKLLPEMHMSHINIVRFTNYHPHIFSTVSFDSTCKIWDLRQKIQGNDPVIKFELPCMAIMSCFTPKDDLKMVVSGIDDYMKQLDLRSKEICQRNFNIPQLGDEHSFRRSLYNSNGNVIYTINTKDKYIRGYSSTDYSLSFSFNTDYFTECYNISGKKNLSSNNSDINGSKIYAFGGDDCIYNSNTEDINNGLSSFNSSINQEQTNSGETNTNIQNNINMQSVRGNPIFDDICGILVTGSEETVFSKPKIALIKFNNNEIRNIC
ncbi:hypothetical protein FG386_001519 [Cryptosporidium ryanae]|uniref:uncharacterized protein n=1 Tax=Cryptosporidium ryanae TaxID=515981 RepID=UPI00351A3CF4|nr:hypothetical protein FG386_001519 [Cryptosporidium ryanae]